MKFSFQIDSMIACIRYELETFKILAASADLRRSKFFEFVGFDQNVTSIAQLMQSSLCVLHWNLVIPETFGLVYAEANTVHTPVLAINAGPVNEVLSQPELQIVDSVQSAVDRLKLWRTRRPIIDGNPNFRISVVIQKWLALFYPNSSLIARFLGPGAPPKDLSQKFAAPRRSATRNPGSQPASSEKFHGPSRSVGSLNREQHDIEIDVTTKVTKLNVKEDGNEDSNNEQHSAAPVRSAYSTPSRSWHQEHHSSLRKTGGVPASKAFKRQKVEI